MGNNIVEKMTAGAKSFSGVAGRASGSPVRVTDPLRGRTAVPIKLINTEKKKMQMTSGIKNITIIKNRYTRRCNRLLYW